MTYVKSSVFRALAATIKGGLPVAAKSPEKSVPTGRNMLSALSYMTVYRATP